MPGSVVLIEGRVPHKLYGVLSGDDICSAGRWMHLAMDAIVDAWSLGRLPILVGGTGLYFTALTSGLTEIPSIPTFVRFNIQEKYSGYDEMSLFLELSRVDPKIASRIAVRDKQRILRALEVFEFTGITLSEWQTRPITPLLKGNWRGYILELPRKEIYKRCDLRSHVIVSGTGVEEVRKVLDYDPRLPIMRAIGVRELQRYIRGEIDIDEARRTISQATRRYAKRQLTWFNNKMVGWERAFVQGSENFEGRIVTDLSQFLLTLS